MNRRGGKISPDPREVPTPAKRGTCIYILEVDIILRLLKDLSELLEKRVLIFKRKLSPQKSDEIVKEVASYICFETVKQVWAYHEGGLPENDTRELLRVLSDCFRQFYGIDSLSKKLEEYMKAENPIEHVSGNIEAIVEHTNIEEKLLIAAHFAAIIGNPEYNLSDCIKEVFALSDSQMVEMIEDFFLNVYPRLIKR